LLRIIPCVPALNGEIAALGVPEFLETFEQRVIKPLVSACDKPYPPNFVRALRQRTYERPSSRAAAE
jgi:hypothetical protein